MQIITVLLADYYLLLVGIGIDELLGCLVLIEIQHYTSQLAISQLANDQTEQLSTESACLL